MLLGLDPVVVADLPAPEPHVPHDDVTPE
jgi:hypothetical protein